MKNLKMLTAVLAVVMSFMIVLEVLNVTVVAGLTEEAKRHNLFIESAARSIVFLLAGKVFESAFKGIKE
jgi:hypothetical protein